MLNVFLIGPMGAGKSAVADVLEAQGYHRYAMATPIREMVRSAFPWAVGKAEQRAYMQQVGAFLRSFHPNPILVHANTALTLAPVVIEDGRTQEEALWAHEKGMLVVVLDATLEVRMKRVLKRDGALPDMRTLADNTEQDFAHVRALRFDTEQKSPEQIAAEILEKAGRDHDDASARKTGS